MSKEATKVPSRIGSIGVTLAVNKGVVLSYTESYLVINIPDRRPIKGTEVGKRWQEVTYVYEDITKEEYKTISRTEAFSTMGEATKRLAELEKVSPIPSKLEYAMFREITLENPETRRSY